MRAKFAATAQPPNRPLRRVVTLAAVGLLAPGCLLVDKALLDTGSPPSSVALPDAATPAVGDTAGPASSEAPSLTLSWTDDTLQVQSHPPAPGAFVGLAETRGPCVALSACWTGEDCRDGFTDAAGRVYGPTCRVLDATGALSLAGGTPIASVDAAHTALRPESAGNITWSLWTAGPDGPTTPCWAGGADPAGEAGCEGPEGRSRTAP